MIDEIVTYGLLRRPRGAISEFGSWSRPIVQHLKFPLAQLAATCKLRGGCLPTAVFISHFSVRQIDISQQLADKSRERPPCGCSIVASAPRGSGSHDRLRSLIPISSLAPLANISTTMRMVALVVLIWIKTALRSMI